MTITDVINEKQHLELNLFSAKVQYSSQNKDKSIGEEVLSLIHPGYRGEILHDPNVLQLHTVTVDDEVITKFEIDELTSENYVTHVKFNKSYSLSIFNDRCELVKTDPRDRILKQEKVKEFTCEFTAMFYMCREFSDTILHVDALVTKSKETVNSLLNLVIGHRSNNTITKRSKLFGFK
jgi:hypothetical protein